MNNPKNYNRKDSMSFYCKLVVTFCILIIILATLNIRAAKLNRESIEQTQQTVSVIEDMLKTHNRSAKSDSPNKPSHTDAEYLASVAWGEAKGCSKTEQAAVMWCVLNRVDSPLYPDTIYEVVTQENQFYGYSASNPVSPDLIELANSVLYYWMEGDDSGRVLPEEYLFFIGDGKHNHFYTEWSKDAEAWDWSLPSPYGEVVKIED